MTSKLLVIVAYIYIIKNWLQLIATGFYQFLNILKKRQLATATGFESGQPQPMVQLQLVTFSLVSVIFSVLATGPLNTINKPYRSILGSVMWGQLVTQPDLSFSVSLLACFQANPGIKHWKVLTHVVGYIKNTIDYGLTYSQDSEISRVTFVDADYGGCKDTPQSTSGYVFTMARGAVTWSSKQQATVRLSTVEAEYMAMSRCAQQMSWMHSWLDEVEIKYSLPGLIKGDNHGAIMLSRNTKDHGKVKHINIQHHYTQELIHSSTIILEQLPSANNLADLFTKPLP